jgi:predicted PurR-regulated permease PerM
MGTQDENNGSSSDELHQLGLRQDRKLVIRAAGTIIAVMIVATLYFAREVLIPITLAALLTFVLTPLVNLLRRAHIPRVPASVMAAVLALALIIGIGTVIGSQIADLAGQLPSYETSIRGKLTRVREVTFAPFSHALARFQSHSAQSSAGEGKSTSGRTRRAA